MDTKHIRSKGRAKDLPFPATIVLTSRRRCRLTALERAAAEWCDRKGIADRPAPLVPPEPAIVAAWLKRLRAKAIEGTLALYQVECGSHAKRNRRLEWRVEFDIKRDTDAYLNAVSVGQILGYKGGPSGFKTVVRLINAGFLAGHEADLHAEHVYGYRRPGWGESVRGRKWRIHPDDLARFLLTHPEQYDRSRVRGNPWKALAAEAARKKRWLRVREVSERLGCTPQQVRDMLRLGDIQGVLMRDREAISYYVRPEWIPATPEGGWQAFACAVSRKATLPTERRAQRERILAQRPALQAKADADAQRLLTEVRDVRGLRRLRREAAELERQLRPTDDQIFPEPERVEARWRAAAAFLRRHPDDGWGEDMAAD